MTINWDEAQTFLAVVEHQTFSKAARTLGIGQPAVSRRIQQLEQRLKQQLFIRGKHGALPTDAAVRLIPAAEQMARWAGEFDRVMSGVERAMSGIVRIAAPPGIAFEQLAPFAAHLRAIEPALTIEILSAVEHIDLTRGMADLAIRTQAPREPELMAWHHGQSQPGVFASVDYAANIKQPCSWQDLDWICWSKSMEHVTPYPILNKLIPGFTPVFRSDDYLVQKSAVESGLGAMVMSQPKTTNLEKIEVGVTLPPYDFYLVSARSMQHVPRVCVVIEALIAWLTQTEA